jgi:hypothetical protein
MLGLLLLASSWLASHDFAFSVCYGVCFHCLLDPALAPSLSWRPAATQHTAWHWQLQVQVQQQYTSLAAIEMGFCGIGWL